MGKKKITIIIGIVFSIFYVSYIEHRENLGIPDAGYVLRRTREVAGISPVTESWENFLRRIILDIFPSITNQNWKELALLGNSFTQVKQHGLVPSSTWISMVVTHLFPNLTDRENILACALEIYNKLQEYEITNFSDASGTPSVTFKKRTASLETSESIDPEDIAIEKMFLEDQRENPYDFEKYRALETLYEELLQRYPQRTYYYWQLSWVWGVLGKSEERRAIFVDGAKKEISPLPGYTPRFPLAQIIQQERTNFLITWGAYKNTDRESLLSHALKYYLQFPEIFIPQGIAVEPADDEAFLQAAIAYKKRAENIIRAEQGTKFYVFSRSGIYEPLYLAYRPDTQEVVGFRIEPSQIGAWCVAIDTFYKASGNMIESLEKEGLIESLLDTNITNLSEQIKVPFDAQPDSFRETRLPEQTEEFRHFGLTEAMYWPAIDKINQIILPAKDKFGVIMIAGVSAAGKSPGGEIIEKVLALQGRRSVTLPMDNYFVDREHMPILTNGKYDFDNPRALDIERFKKDLTALLEGKEVEIPYYDFKSGESTAYSGVKLRLEPGDILKIEGIHALNPDLTGFVKNLKINGGKIPQVRLFIDAPKDIRLARRLVRDWATRGNLPINTLAQWPSVRYGEDAYIYPTMQYADVIINTNTGEDFYQSELYSIFYDALPQALEDAKRLGNTELIETIQNLIEFCRPLSSEEVPMSIP